MKDELMISVSGIRGIFGTALKPETVLKYGAAFGRYCEKKKKQREEPNKHKQATIVIGRDSRTTGKTLTYALKSALLGVGCKVIDLDIVATPTLLLAVKMLQADGGICVTASHNPAEWNALKLCSHRGMFLYPEEAQQFLELAGSDIDYAAWNEQGELEGNHLMSVRHIEKILAIPYLNIEKIRDCNFRVVVDSVNGAGGLISPHLLKKLGCTIKEINSEPTGLFARKPEPLSGNLDQLKKAVVDFQADIGFATDPDVDRLSIISEKGEAIGEELSLVLAAKYVLSQRKGDIVTNCSTTMAIDDIAKESGVKVYRTKVGEINVGKMMTEVAAAVGGEGNGGVICPEVNYTRDAPVGMALILALLAEKQIKMSEMVNTIPKYYITKDKIKGDALQIEQALTKAEEQYKNEKIDKTDGLKIIGDRYWIHIRKSGTEPILRVYVESDSQQRSNHLCQDAINKITS